MDAPSSNAQAKDSGALLPAEQSGENPEEAARSGFLAGVCEAFLLLWCIPGFGMVSLYSALLSGGASLAWTFVFPVLESQIWLESAASNAAWMNAARCFMSVLLCAHFGGWSDKHSRKAAIVVMTLASFVVGFPVLVFGSTNAGLVSCVVLVVVTGPFAVHLSGSPVLWAWASDYLAPEHKEVGFAMIGAFSAGGSFLVLIGANALGSFFSGPEPFVWVSVGCCLVCLGIVALAPPGAHMPDLAAEDLAEEKGLMQALFGPMRLVAKNPTLRATCAVVALLTLPDMAANDIAPQILYNMLDISTDPSAMRSASNLFQVYPRPLTVIAALVFGVCARRFGPHRLVRVTVPITAVLFAFPVILKFTGQQNGFLIILSGFFTLFPLSNYGPLQALVCHIVSPRQIGEAMGAIATCKNLVSLIAPLLIGAFTSYLENTDNTDKLWVVYPACAFIMLCGWPFTFCLERRVPRDTTATWSTWASASKPSTIRSNLNARSSAMFSARP